MREYMPEMCDDELESLLLNQAQERKVDVLTHQLDELNEFTILL